MEAVEGTHLVYLMYRADRGYRIGRTKAVRKDGRGDPEIGYRVRVNQEHGDKLWVLRVCDSLTEAAYFESWFAATYGLPTACFHAVGRAGVAMDDEWLQRLFEEVDTESAAKHLMDEWLLHPDYPHYRPQNGARRQTLNLTMFSDIRSGRPSTGCNGPPTGPTSPNASDAPGSRCVAWEVTVPGSGSRPRGPTTPRRSPWLAPLPTPAAWNSRRRIAAVRSEDRAGLRADVPCGNDVRHLRHRDLGWRHLLLVLEAPEPECEELALRELRHHPGELLLLELERGDGPVELDPVQRVVERRLVAGVGRAERAPGDAVARLREAREGPLEPLHAR